MADPVTTIVAEFPTEAVAEVGTVAAISLAVAGTNAGVVAGVGTGVVAAASPSCGPPVRSVPSKLGGLVHVARRWRVSQK